MKRKHGTTRESISKSHIKSNTFQLNGCEKIMNNLSCQEDLKNPLTLQQPYPIRQYFAI